MSGKKTENDTGNVKRKLFVVPVRKWLVPVLLASVIAVQTVYIGNIFFYRKTSCFCDEIYSYGLSNSFFSAYLEGEDVYSYEEYHTNEWFSGGLFHDYLTVQKDERFRYDSVWYNQEHDRHPPLFYATLHTLCSFIPEQFSFVPGFVLNIICFVVTQVFLFLLARELLRSEYLALLFVGFWGFTMAAVNITIFVRMYCMLTMWTIIMMYLHARLFRNQDKLSWRMWVSLAAVTMLGGLTQYLFYFVAFVTAVLFCLHFLLNRKTGLFLKYGFSMLGGVAAAFAVYPAAIRQLFSEGDHAKGIDVFAQLPLALRYISSDIFRLTESELLWLLRCIPLLLLIFIVLSLPLLFLFRKNKRVAGFFSGIRNKVRNFPSKLRDITPGKIYDTLKRSDPLPAAMLISSVFVVIVVSFTVSFISGFCNRYFYSILPLAALLVFMLICKIAGNGKAGRAVITVMYAALVVHITFFSALSPVWTVKNTLDLKETLSGCNVGVVYSHDIGYDTMSAFSYELCDTRNVFYTTLEDVLTHGKEVSSLSDDKPLYVMLYASDSGNDDRGEYVTDLQRVKEKYYVDDLLKAFEDIKGISGHEYVGDYVFVEGHFKIYIMT